MKGNIGDKQRLLHILAAITEIEHYTSEVKFNTFLENSMMRFSSIKQIEIIGEAANYVSEETKKQVYSYSVASDSWVTSYFST